MKFFLNSNSHSYLRNLEFEFGESTNSIRLELNKFEQAGLITSAMAGNKKVFRANTSHPLYSDIHNILLKYIGFDQILERVVHKLGNVKEVYITGDFARGLDGPIIDLVFIGNEINTEYLLRLVEKTEALINRKIRYVVFRVAENPKYHSLIRKDKALLLFKRD